MGTTAAEALDAELRKSAERPLWNEMGRAQNRKVSIAHTDIFTEYENIALLRLHHPFRQRSVI